MSANTLIRDPVIAARASFMLGAKVRVTPTETAAGETITLSAAINGRHVRVNLLIEPMARTLMMDRFAEQYLTPAVHELRAQANGQGGTP